MATATPTKRSAVISMVEPLLNPYEDFMFQADVPGVSGYVMTLRTNLMVHIKHTRKNVFRPHTVYQATSLTALPNKPFTEAWLKNARQAATAFINKGDFTDEKLVAGEWQSWKRKYNQWIYYDRQRNLLFGTVNQVERDRSRTDSQANTKALEN